MLIGWVEPTFINTVGAAIDLPPTTHISESRRRVHITTEALSIFVAAPFSFWLATQRSLPASARALSMLIGIAIVIVDGGLLATWPKRST